MVKIDQEHKSMENNKRGWGNRWQLIRNRILPTSTNNFVLLLWRKKQGILKRNDFSPFRWCMSHWWMEHSSYLIRCWTRHCYWGRNHPRRWTKERNHQRQWTIERSLRLHWNLEKSRRPRSIWTARWT